MKEYICTYSSDYIIYGLCVIYANDEYEAGLKFHRHKESKGDYGCEIEMLIEKDELDKIR